MMMKFKNMKALNDVVLDYTNPWKMFELAREYDRLKQGAAAFGWYLRAADFCEGETYEEKWLQYKCMLLGAAIFDRSEARNQTTQGLLKMAMAVLPDRPEAYYFMAKHSIDTNNFRDGLMYSQMGLALDLVERDDDNGLGYPGHIGLKHTYAVSKWKTDGRDDSKNLFFDLKHKNKLEMTKEIRESVDWWIGQVGYPSTLPYKIAEQKKYKWNFDGLTCVEKNYSRHFQDMFVLSLLNGKMEGTFVEIGSGHPTLFNNTYLLEKDFNWRGLSVEHSERMCAQFSRERSTSIVMDDAATLDYDKLFKQQCLEQHIEYLRLNADQASLAALGKIPFSKYEFSIIQFQHNECWWGSDIKEKSREMLSSIGYKLFVSDVAIDPVNSYEDWWVHPSHINNHMKSNQGTNFAWDYMMKERK
jgi:hypothetical protein